MTVSNSKSDTPKREELRARVRFIHDKHYISKDDGTITDKDINAAIDDTLALVEQEIASARIDELKRTICHKDGGWENCRQLKQRIKELEQS